MDCNAWGETFDLSFPILDDSYYNIFPMITDNYYIPYNVVINHEMEVVYSVGGYDHTSLVNALQSAMQDLP